MEYISSLNLLNDCFHFIYRILRLSPDLCLQCLDFCFTCYMLLTYDYYAWHLWITVCSHCLITLSLFNHCICSRNHCILTCISMLVDVLLKPHYSDHDSPFAACFCLNILYIPSLFITNYVCWCYYFHVLFSNILRILAFFIDFFDAQYHLPFP